MGNKMDENMIDDIPAMVEALISLSDTEVEIDEICNFLNDVINDDSPDQEVLKKYKSQRGDR